ncbi:hypothetical protein [Brachybacterium hainanense]|uniref:Uncharacterized protein n=1 Tax=Brachybacterium hainanense TaxID=1541174 RepID=A0ABV6RDH5_9MICO
MVGSAVMGAVGALILSGSVTASADPAAPSDVVMGTSRAESIFGMSIRNGDASIDAYGVEKDDVTQALWISVHPGEPEAALDETTDAIETGRADAALWYSPVSDSIRIETTSEGAALFGSEIGGVEVSVVLTACIGDAV